MSADPPMQWIHSCRNRYLARPHCRNGGSLLKGDAQREGVEGGFHERGSAGSKIY